MAVVYMLTFLKISPLRVIQILHLITIFCGTEKKLSTRRGRDKGITTLTEEASHAMSRGTLEVLELS